MKLPVKVPHLDKPSEVLVLTTEQELMDYYQEMYRRMTKVRNMRGDPEPNYVFIIPEELREMGRKR